MLKIWGILETDICTFCQKREETTMHLMWECEKIQELWHQIGEKIKMWCPELGRVDITRQNVIYNNIHKDASHVINLIVLAVKMKIYTERCLKNKIHIDRFVYFINECRNIEKYNALSTGNFVKHVKKWSGAEKTSEIFDCERYAEQYLVQNDYFSK